MYHVPWVCGLPGLHLATMYPGSVASQVYTLPPYIQGLSLARLATMYPGSVACQAYTLPPCTPGLRLARLTPCHHVPRVCRSPGLPPCTPGLRLARLATMYHVPRVCGSPGLLPCTMYPGSVACQAYTLPPYTRPPKHWKNIKSCWGQVYGKSRDFAVYEWCKERCALFFIVVNEKEFVNCCAW